MNSLRNVNISQLTAAELDELIFLLAQKRSEIDPAIPMKIDDLAANAGTSLHQQLDPAMAIAPHLETNGIRLILRSGGLGWIEFVISQSNSFALRDWLLNRYGIEGDSIFSKQGSSQDPPIQS